jgi:hypothetical protein
MLFVLFVANKVTMGQAFLRVNSVSLCLFHSANATYSCVYYTGMDNDQRPQIHRDIVSLNHKIQK